MHNDGRPVSPEKFLQTFEELITQFGAGSFYPQTIRGVRLHQGTRYEDECRRIVVDVVDTEASERFFAEWKPTLLERFEQIEIYITSIPIRVH